MIIVRANKWYRWTEKTEHISFYSKVRSVGNGEEKLRVELGIKDTCRGQNSTVDLYHPIFKNISVKDMTKDDCVLGVESCHRLNNLLFNTVYSLLIWLEVNKNVKDRVYIDRMKKRINKNYGNSKLSLMESIFRKEVTAVKIRELTLILEQIKYDYLFFKDDAIIFHIVNYMKTFTFSELLNEISRKEATSNSLFIVDKKKGFYFLTDLEKISCSRITRSSPRITVNI